jgi:hypothetical protein
LKSSVFGESFFNVLCSVDSFVRNLFQLSLQYVSESDKQESFSEAIRINGSTFELFLRYLAVDYSITELENCHI